MITKPLRFGVMVPAHEIAWWQAEVLRRLISTGVGTPALVIVESTPRRPRKRGRFHRETPWNLYQRLLVRGRVPASRPEPWRPLMPEVGIIEVAAERRGRFSEYFSDQDLERVRQHELDFVLRFGFNILRGDILKVPRYGVWSYHHGDLFEVRGQPACFWELYRDASVTGITLQRLTDALDAGVVLGMRHIATTRKSYVRTRDTALRAGVSMVEQTCRAVLRGDLEAVTGEPAQTKAPVDRAPDWMTVGAFMVKLACRRVRETSRWLFTDDQWNVGVVKASPTDVAAGRLPEPQWLPHPPRGEFLADAFAARIGEEIVVLAEHLSERDRIGRLRCIRLDARNNVLSVSEPVSAEVHLSYPFLLRDGSRFLCVPEMAEAGEVGIWESKDGLKTWSRIGTLLHGLRLIDPTVFQYGGRWWLFGVIRSDARVDELHAWHAANPLGPWAPHAGNPIKVDARSTRPAGTPFSVDGVLHRPSQDCSRTYGGAISINRVDELSPHRFRETTVARIECAPDWAYRSGTHTIAQIDKNTFVVDAKRVRLSAASFLRQMRARFRRPASRAQISAKQICAHSSPQA